jgi:hypothetical protein
MTIRPIRGRARAAAAALCGIAAVAITACAPSAPGTAAVRQESVTVTTFSAVSVPAVIDCAGHAQTRPGQYVLACGNGGAFLAGLHWPSWGPAAAFGDGISTFNDCQPNCLAGHGHSYPVLVALWRAEPLPGHLGKRYFTRLTIIDTGSRTYRAAGKVYHLPLTRTYPLSPFGGA